MMLRNASIALLVLGCGGKVIVDQPPAGSGGAPSTSTHGTLSTATSNPTMTSGIGGSGNAVGVTGVGGSGTGFGGSVGIGVGVGGGTGFGGFAGGSSVVVGAGGEGFGGFNGSGGSGVICQDVSCSGDSQGDCSCSGHCNGEKVRVQCGTDPGIQCQCFVNNHFVGHCTPASTGQCEPEDSCCAAFL